VLQVAANDVQVLNSVNSKLPFLVTTSDDAKDSLKEEIRLRLVYLYLCRLDSHRCQNLNICRVYWSFPIDVVVHVIYLANFISDLLLILVEMREFCVGPIVKFHNTLFLFVPLCKCVGDLLLTITYLQVSMS
jgi:hypothetical protein